MSPLAHKVAELLHPLTDFYRSAGARAPAVEQIGGETMPQPYRRLLVHDNDMTPTLEAYCGNRIHLRRLDWREAEDALYRQVVLVVNGEQRPIEFGAIKIHLHRFEDEPRQLILEGHRPLGRILHEYAIPHYSRPTGFFRIGSDPVIEEAFGMAGSRTLYGRHNVLRDTDDRPLAEVVEILPPLPEDGTAENGSAAGK